MRLYTQTLLILTISFLAVISLLLILFQFAVMENFSSLEKRYTTADLDRAEDLIADETLRIEGICRDWGAWDELYAFMETHDSAFFRSNFDPGALARLNISSVLLIAPDGEVEGVRSDGRAVPEDLILRVRACITPEGISGLITTPEGPAIIAAEPILTSLEEGPSRGTIVMIRMADTEFIGHISNYLGENLTVSGQGPEKHGILPEYTQGIRVIHSLNGGNALTLTARNSHELYQNGISSRNFLLLSLFLLTFLFLLISTILLYRSIIAPIRYLNTELTHIGVSGSLSGRVSLNQDDELGELARTINRMLTSLDSAEQERMSTERRWRTLLEIADEGICTLDAEKRIQFVNRKCAAIFGIPEEDLIGQPIASLYTATEGEPKGPGRGTESTHGEFRSRTVSGKSITLRISSAPFTGETGEQGEICVISDISSFRQKEQELLLSNKKLDLLGSMTRHDIVNQLTTIRGMLALALRKNTDESLIRFLVASDEAAAKIHAHIEFSKEYQKVGIEQPKWQNLRTVANLAYAFARKKEVTFSVQGEDYEIWADQLLQKVFFNLIENSIRHGEKVSTIIIRTAEVGDALNIRYTDDGVGIPPEMKEKIFNRGIGTGTGWGLFFVREVLSLTGISVTETGTPGNGACFEILIPEGAYKRI